MKKFRVEAFIVPSRIDMEQVNSQDDDANEHFIEKLRLKTAEDQEIESPNCERKENIIIDNDDFCKSNDPNEVEEEDMEQGDQCSSEFSGLFFEIDEHIYDEIIIPNKNVQKLQVRSEKINTQYSKAFLQIEEPIYDEPFVGNLTKITANNKNYDPTNIYDVPQSNWMLGNSKYCRFGIVAPKIPKRSSSLKSITEDIENFEDSLDEVCCHGRKCGCQMKRENPEDISEDIFKENWMKRLDALRKLETLLKDKEIALQSRERLLFKKEKELRILERLVKDKMRQAELYAKRYKKSLSQDSISNNNNNNNNNERIVESRSSSGSKGRTATSLSSNAQSRARLKGSSSMNAVEIENRANLKNSAAANCLYDEQREDSVRLRSRQRRKIRYEDLDSTLSADTGDSSSVVASKKSNVTRLKNAKTFTRSASERRPTVDQKITAARLASLIENDERAGVQDGYVNVVEEKTIKRISENILASQDQSTKFLNYGLIDKESTIKSLDRKSNRNRISYLNLESVNKANKSKERPVTWNAETDDWLMKKRLAYNMATKNMSQEIGIEKENVDRQSKLNKSAKVIAKKESNKKKFSIFR